MPIKIFFYEFILKISSKFIFKKVRLSAFKIVTTFLMCCALQRHEINLILRVSIKFNSFLRQNFILMCCKLQRHEINSVKVFFMNKTILKNCYNCFFMPIKVFL